MARPILICFINMLFSQCLLIVLTLLVGDIHENCNNPLFKLISNFLSIFRPLKTREKDKAIKGRKQCEDDTFPAKVRKTQQSLDQ